MDFKNVYQEGDFGYIKQVKKDKFEIIVNGGTCGHLAGSKNNINDAINSIKRMAKYPRQTYKFLGIFNVG